MCHCTKKCLQTAALTFMVTGSRDITAHIHSQSEMAKVGAVNEESTNHPFTTGGQKCMENSIWLMDD